MTVKSARESAGVELSRFYNWYYYYKDEMGFKIRDNNGRPRLLTSQQKRKIIALKRKGFSDKKVADIIGSCQATIYNTQHRDWKFWEMKRRGKIMQVGWYKAQEKIHRRKKHNKNECVICAWKKYGR